MAIIPSFINNLPQPNPLFTGRQIQLKKIRELISTEHDILVINGIAGIGKTAILREFCYKFQNNFEHFIWLSGKNGILENLSYDKNLATNLKIEAGINNVIDISKRIINKLNTIEGDNVIIFDDVDENFTLIRQIITLKSNWKMLITSRFKFDELPTLNIGPLTSDESKELFYKHYNLQQNDKIINTIFAPLGFHPLSIELFAKTAQFHKLPLRDLNKRVLKLGFEFSSKTSINTEHSAAYIDNIGKYYDKIFPLKKIPKEEIVILRKLAVLPSGFTEINILFKLLEITPEKEDDFSYGINRLVQKGWVDNFGTSYKLNTLINRFIEYKFPLSVKFYLPQIKIVSKLLNVDTVKNSPVPVFKWLKYGQKYCNTFGFENADIVTLANNLALRYRDNGKYEFAKDLLKEVLNHDIKVYGNDSKIVEMSRANLGNLYSDLGNYEKARELLEQSLEAAIKSYPADDPKIAARQSNLGLVYRDLGEYNKAIDLLKNALESDLRNFAPDNPNVAVRQSNLALAYKDFGEYKKSQELLEKSIATTIKNFGDHHPRVALRRSNLALVYKAMGEYRKAIDLLELALESDIKNFGEVHHKIAVRLMNMAIIYLEINEISKAKEKITNSLNIAITTLGASHPDTLEIKKMKDKICGI